MKVMPLNKFRAYLELSKLNIMIPVSLTGFTGYFMYEPLLTSKILIVTAGILLMAISASVLNQVQERGIDSKMKRTCLRPLPSGRINTSLALVFFLFTLISGTVLVYIAGNAKAAAIGLLTIFWYNVIYTYSKQITAFAVVPGAVTGALPPLIGWVAASGGVLDKPIIFLGFLFLMGQIPHFWLLILNYGDEYKQAGLPSISGILKRSQIRRLSFTWVACTVFAALLLCYIHVIHNTIITGMLLTISALLLWQFSDLLKPNEGESNTKKYSFYLDLYILLVLILLILDRIV